MNKKKLEKLVAHRKSSIKSILVQDKKEKKKKNQYAIKSQGLFPSSFDASKIYKRYAGRM